MDASAATPAASDAVTTEPIAIVGGPLAAEAARASAAASSTAAVDADATAVIVAEVAAETSATPDPRAAKKALAAAERARRRYERGEVRRFTKRSRRRRLAWIAGLGAVAVVVGGVLGAAYSPLMALREVRVEGASMIPAADIVTAFGPELGTPLPLIASADVQQVLAQFPLIETYSTEMVPPGTLIVRVVERTPVGVVATEGGLELVDAAGVVIDRPAERPEGQPLIETEGGVTGAGFRAAAAVIRALPPEVRAQLVGASAETADDVRLELAGGATVVWGSAEDSGTKAAVLTDLMAAAPPDTVSGYDVSSAESAVTF